MDTEEGLFRPEGCTPHVFASHRLWRKSCGSPLGTATLAAKMLLPPPPPVAKRMDTDPLPHPRTEALKHDLLRPDGCTPPFFASHRSRRKSSGGPLTEMQPPPMDTDPPPQPNFPNHDLLRPERCAPPVFVSHKSRRKSRGGPLSAPPLSAPLADAAPPPAAAAPPRPAVATHSSPEARFFSPPPPAPPPAPPTDALELSSKRPAIPTRASPDWPASPSSPISLAASHTQIPHILTGPRG